jgi:hypothetical protein
MGTRMSFSSSYRTNGVVNIIIKCNLEDNIAVET